MVIVRDFHILSSEKFRCVHVENLCLIIIGTLCRYEKFKIITDSTCVYILLPLIIIIVKVVMLIVQMIMIFDYNCHILYKIARGYNDLWSRKKKSNSHIF